MARESLGHYREKRDFSATPEPEGEPFGPGEGPLTFMVHRHAARRLHHDLRIELDGVLVSWAVPRGPTTDTSARRLAVQTEDHPMDYGNFEGNIPAGEYGGGSSLIWDAGSYSPDEDGLLFHDREAAEAEVRAGLERGKLSLVFRGKRLKGSWALVKTKTDWLLLKHRDVAANASRDVTEEVTSVVSGLSNEELWARGAGERRSVPVHYSPAVLDGAKAGPVKTVAPMLACADRPIPAEGWSFEPKLDGNRLIAYLDGGDVRLVSRGGHDVTSTYPGIAKAMARQPAGSLVLDGEVVAVDKTGRPSFELLQQRMNLQYASDIETAERRVPVVMFTFDVLHADGYDVTRAPQWQRRELLERVVLPLPELHLTATIDLPPEEAYQAAVDHGFEGIIAKRVDGRYEPGKRSDNWRKRKATRRGVFTVGGWTAGEGSRSGTFGALLVGERQPDGSLAYRGRVGGGFREVELRRYLERLHEMASDTSPFSGPVPEARRARWVRPELEIAVEYAEITNDGKLRAPIHKGLPGEVETGDSPPPAAASARTPPPGDDRQTLRQTLEDAKERTTLRGAGWHMGVTNLNKAMWPATDASRAFTKRDLLLYAIDVWPVVAPHLGDRLLTLTRFPEGASGEHFYQKHWETRRPSFVETVRVYSDTDERDKDFLLCNNLPTLLWLCQLADIEWHVGLARTAGGEDAPGLSTNYVGSREALSESVLNYPDTLLFDIDPYIYRGNEKRGEEPQPNEAGFEAGKEAAFSLRTLLDGLGLPSVVKTSGATGLHIFVPLKRTLDFGAVRAFAQTIAAELVRQQPRKLTVEWAQAKRRGKVFLDANQNGRHKALAAAYSPRAHPGAPVSMPLGWDELAEARLGEFTIANVPGILEKRDDAWRNLRQESVDLREMLGVE